MDIRVIWWDIGSAMVDCLCKEAERERCQGKICLGDRDPHVHIDYEKHCRNRRIDEIG